MPRPAPLQIPPLGPADCHVWWTSLDDCREGHESLLDPVERERRAAYLAAADRNRFTLGAVTARIVLGALLGIAPDRVEVDRTCPDCGRPHGRARLAAGTGPGFSVSHSGDMVVVAFSANQSVGVDVEWLGRACPPELTEIVLSPAERVDLDRLTPAERAHGFLRYWVRKEAVLKATGQGLRVAMTDVAVSAPDEPARLISWTGRPELPGRVHLADLSCAPAYVASLAVVGRRPTVHEFDAGPLIRPYRR